MSNPKRKFRQARKGEVICNCSAYKFPHRMMGGKCNGTQWVNNYLHTDMSRCGECMFMENGWCNIDMGQEHAHHCPALIDFLRYEEVPVPKRLRKRKWD